LGATLSLVCVCGPAAARAKSAAIPASTPVATSQPTSRPTINPFARLTAVAPVAHLPPIKSVRIRDKREEEDRSRKGTVTIHIKSHPKGASVMYGGKFLGRTPVQLKAPRGSTPFDVVVKARGYMTLRTRVRRKVSRTYFYKLAPAKFR
jgi:hypothetical protein